MDNQTQKPRRGRPRNKKPSTPQEKSSVEVTPTMNEKSSDAGLVQTGPAGSTGLVQTGPAGFYTASESLTRLTGQGVTTTDAQPDNDNNANTTQPEVCVTSDASHSTRIIY